MAADAYVENRPPRLDPFVFPPDTTFRFVLLIVSVIGASLFLYNALNFNLTYKVQIAQLEQCKPPDIPNLGSPLLEREAYARYQAADAAYWSCLAPYELARAGWQLGGLALLLAVAAGIYWMFPAWIIRRSGLEPLTVEDHPELVAYLQALCHETGLARPPQFLWNPLNTTSAGLAFGRRGRHYVMLSGGLVQQFVTDRAAFRAIMLHELAHLRNADVDKTYFAVAIALAFVLAALVPYALYLLRDVTTGVDWPFLLGMSWRALALGALVYLTLAGVLRTREVYADARAAVWDGPASALGRIFEMGHRSPTPRVQWWAWLRFHPDAGERRQALEEPQRLLRMGFWEVFGTGVAASIAIDSVQELLSAVQRGLQLPISASIVLIAAIIFALLIAGVAGTGMWRTVFVARARGETPRGALRLGLGLGSGIILGRAVAFQSVAFQLQDQSNTLAFWITRIVLAILLLFSLVLFLKWIAVSASVWLDVTMPGDVPRRTYAASLILAAVILAVWSGALLQSNAFSSEFSDLGIFGFIIVGYWILLQRPFIFLTLVSLWALPLAAGFVRSPVAPMAGASSPSGDTTSGPLAPPQRAPLRFRLVLGSGVAGGLAFCTLGLAFRIWLRRNIPEAERSSPEFLIAFYNWHIVRAAIIQMLVAVVVAGWTERLGVLRGLASAFVAGCVMAIGASGLNLWYGGTIDVAFAWLQLSTIVVTGGLSALVAALVVSALAGRFRMALRPGLLGGVVFCALWLCFVVAASFLLPGDLLSLVFDIAFVTLAALAQAGVAAVTVVRVRRWRVLHSLMAALVTASMATGGVAGLTLSHGATLRPDFLVEIFGYFTRAVAAGMLLALPTALVVAGVSWALRRGRRGTTEVLVDVEPALGVDRKGV